MTRKSPALHTPAEIVTRLKSSIAQVSDHRLELTALGLDQARHQPTPLQNQLLAAACTNLEAWVEIQKTKLEHMKGITRKQGDPIPPETVWSEREGEEQFIPLDLGARSCVLRTDGIQLGPQNPPTPEVSS